MKYNLAIPESKKEAMSYFMTLVNKKAVVEVKKVNQNRTINQNKYLHVLIGAFGAHFGYTAAEAKDIYKQLNSDIYRYEKKGRVFWRSSSDLDKEEMAKSIDTFMKRSAEAGYVLPPADDREWIRHLENEIERMGYFM